MDKEMPDVVEGTTEIVQGEVEDIWTIQLKKPIKFEGKNYDKIDLAGMQDITAGDMIEINRRMTRSGCIDINPELTLEYAVNMANIVTGRPLEFFDKLPGPEAIKLKGRVTNFLYR